MRISRSKTIKKSIDVNEREKATKYNEPTQGKRYDTEKNHNKT